MPQQTPIVRRSRGPGHFEWRIADKTKARARRACVGVLADLLFGSPGWIRTTECLSQSQVPYRLATGLYCVEAEV